MTVLLYCCLCVGFFCALGEREQSRREMEKNIFSAEMNLLRLRVENVCLRQEEAKLYDDHYLTILAREKLGYIFPGEKICLFAEVHDDVLPLTKKEIPTAD